MIKIKTYKTGTIDNDALTYAVICAKYKEKWVFGMHEDRSTWEVPGGHRESGELIDDAAKRELFEETGAVEFELSPICDYSVTRQNETGYGRLYFADIKKLGNLPDLEIKKIAFFETLPENLTYPKIQPALLEIVKNKISRRTKNK